MIYRKLLAVLVLVAASSAAKVEAAPIHVGVAIDGSGSINAANFQVQIQGIAAAVNNVFGSLPDGTVRFSMVQFASGAQVEVANILITSSNLASVVANILNTIQTGGGTNFEAALDVLSQHMASAIDYDASDRAVINISTDGQGSLGNGVLEAVALGIDEISAEAIGPGANVIFLRDFIAYPQPGVIAPPFATGQGFVIPVSTFAEFEAAFTQKLQFVVTQQAVPEPASLALWGIGSCLGLIAIRRRKSRMAVAA